MNHAEFIPELATNGPTERLKWGMFPRSLVFWIGLFHMATVVIRPWEKLLPELAPLRFERVLGITMVGLVALNYKWELRGGLITIAILAFVAMMFVTSQFAMIPELCERDLVAMVSTLISFFVIIFVTRSTYQLYFLLLAYIGIVFLYITKAQWEYFFNGAAMYQMGVRRLAGIEYYYRHPNAVGGSVVCSLPIAYFLYQVRHEFTQTWPRKFRKLFPWFLYSFGAVAISGILLTRSRTAAICLVVLALLAVFTSSKNLFKKVQWLLIMGCVFVAAFFVLPEDMQGRIQTIWDSTVERDGMHRGATASGEGRVVGFWMGMKMFQRHPWTGVGLANYKEYREAKLDGTYLDAHNLAAEIMSETGILGTASFVILLCVVVWTLLRARKRANRIVWHSDGIGLSLLAVSCLQVLAMLLMQGIASHNLHRYNWFWLAAFAALCARQVRAAEREDAYLQDQYQADDAYWDDEVFEEEVVVA